MDSGEEKQTLQELQMRFLMSTPGCIHNIVTLHDSSYTHNEENREQLSASDIVKAFEKYKSEGETKWKR
jgi:hypothetical protein